MILEALVGIGVGKIVAQAVAIVLVTPLNFVGNKLWSFKARPRLRTEPPGRAGRRDAASSSRP